MRCTLCCAATSAVFRDPDLVFAQSPLAEMVIETTEELEPRTASEFIAAVNNLLNVGADDRAREYFLRLAKQSLSQEDLADLYHQLGAATFLQLGRESALAPEGAEFAQRVVAAAKAWAENPQQLLKKLALIGSASAEGRILALHRFAEGREQAAVMLLQQLAHPQCPYDKPRLREAWSYIGRSAAQPAVAALFSPHVALQFEALQALSIVGTEADQPFLAAYALRCRDSQLRQMALQASSQSPGPALRLPGLRQLVEHAVISRMRDDQRAREDSKHTIWTWDDQELNARSQLLPSRIARFVEANRLCHKLASADRRYAELYLLTELGLHHQLARQGDLRSQWKSFTQPYGAPPTTGSLAQSLAWALQYDVPEAAVTACEFLSLLLENSQTAPELTAVAELSDALRSPDAELRQTAALALMKSDPQVPFTGAADLLQIALRMATTRGQRRAVVVHPAALEANQLAGLLISAGWLADTANSGKQTLRLLLESADVELILLSTELFRPRYSELLQQLQADYRTREVPTVLLDPAATMRGLEHLELRWPDLQAFPFPVDQQRLDELLRRADAQRERRSPATRYTRAKIALRWLAQLADEWPKRSFYELAGLDQRLAVALEQPELVAEAAVVLGKLGTPEARQALQAALTVTAEDSMERHVLERALSEAVTGRSPGPSVVSPEH